MISCPLVKIHGALPILGFSCHFETCCLENSTTFREQTIKKSSEHIKAEVPHVRPSYLLHTAGASLYPGHLHLLLHRLAGLAALCQQLVVLTSRQERLIWFRKPSRQQAVSYKNQKEISDWYHGPYWPYSLQTGQQWFLSIMQGEKYIIARFPNPDQFCSRLGHSFRLFLWGGVEIERFFADDYCWNHFY